MDPSSKFTGHVSDMRTPEGETVRREAESISTEMALRLSLQIADSPTYMHLASLLPEPKVALYFEKVIKDSILYTVLDMCIARWESDNCAPDGPRNVIWSGHRGLLRLLEDVWPDPAFPICESYTRRWSRKALRPTLVRLYRHSKRSIQRLKGADRASVPLNPGSKPSVSFLFNEGIDPARRSDAFWLPFSGVAPERVLALIQHRPSIYGGKRVPRKATEEITAMGMNWIAMAEGFVEDSDSPAWETPRGLNYLFEEFRNGLGKPAGITEKWIHAISEWLVREVDYWRAFYRAANTKIHIEVGNAADKQIAQNIALELEGGLRIGYQRSEIGTEDGGALGHHPDHVCFLWNTRSADDVERNRNRVDTMIVTGFPFGRDSRQDSETQALKDQLKKNHAEFTVALFDAGYWWGGTCTRLMNLSFYSAFLDWVLGDSGAAVIVKSKKLNPLDQFPELQESLRKAEATGRWVNLPNPVGRRPSDASMAADISIGLGISSAVSEAVALGGRAVFCDLTSMHRHAYYQVGKDQVVFDDLDRLMNSLKRFRRDPASEASLGDFSGAMDQVDPFCDGRGDERVGNYVGWLMEGFDAGLSREEAVQQANEKYAATWGDWLVIGTETRPTVLTKI